MTTRLLGVAPDTMPEFDTLPPGPDALTASERNRARVMARLRGYSGGTILVRAQGRGPYERLLLRDWDASGEPVRACPPDAWNATTPWACVTLGDNAFDGGEE